MAAKGIVLSLVMVMVANVWTETAAQSGCSSALTSMAPCLNYITGSSLSPSSSCCSQLSSVVQTSPQCLCSVLNSGGSSLGITINKTLALSLPGACKVQTPPVSQCKAGNGPTTPSTAPVGSPFGSPADSSSESPKGSVTPSGSDTPSDSGVGSKTVPSTDGSSSAGSIIKVPSGFVFFLLLILSSASAVAKF